MITTKKCTASVMKSCLLHFDLLLVTWIPFDSSRFNLKAFMKHLLCEQHHVRDWGYHEEYNKGTTRGTHTLEGRIEVL